jgi:hypothetical protein
MQLLVVPLLTENNLPLLHNDEFQRRKVLCSSFTLENDIFLQIEGGGFMVFDQHGNQLNISVDESLLDPDLLVSHF